MISKLQDNPKFIAEYTSYQKRISAVTDEKLQQDLLQTLIKLRDHVQFLDRSHEQVFLTGRLPTEISELRGDLLKYRKTLDQKLENWERRQYIKPEPLPNEE